MKALLVLLTVAAVTASPAFAGSPGLTFHASLPTFDCGFDDPNDTCDGLNANSLGVASQQVVVLMFFVAEATAAQFGINYTSTGETDIFASTPNCDLGYQSISLDGPNGP